MPSWSFTRSPSSELYLYSDTGTPVSGQSYRIAFLRPVTATGGSATLTLGQSWSDEGVYLFYQETPANEPAFVADIRAYLAGGLAGTRFLWIGNSAAAPAFWGITTIAVAGSAPALLSRYAEIGFQNYRLCLNRGLAVTLADPATGAAAPAFVIDRGAVGQVRLETGTGDPPLTGIGTTVKIPLSGAAIGSICFQLDSPKSASSGSGSEMGSLDCGFAFFYPDPEWGSAFLSRLTYPLLSLARAAVRFYPALDPLNPLLPTRTLFALSPPDGGVAAQLTSYYRTWVGRGVGLTPVAGTLAGFALSPRPRYPGDETPSYTLTPNGTFTIDIAPLIGSVPVTGESESATRVMCGLSPVEYIGYLPPVAGTTIANTVTFYPGNPAFAASFNPGSESASAGGLGDTATTSYVAFTPNGPAAINYYSQPDQSVFYDAATGSQAADANFLDMKEIVTGRLSSGEAAAMPMVPLAGLGTMLIDQAMHTRFEVKVISQTRRDLVHSGLGVMPSRAALNTKTPVTSNATTRHGMLGFFGAPQTSEVPIVKVQLAQSGGGAQTLILAGSGGGDITGELKQAIQSNQLFLVMSNATLFAEQGTFLSAMLKIADLPFDLSPEHWQKNGTIFVYKYAGASIANLAADLGAWSFPQSFTDGAMTQSNLLTTLEGIRAKVEVAVPDPDFLHVYEAVTNPAWNGILVFNSEVTLAAMPSQLAGMAAGIDPSRFRAHHVGINISPMDVVNGRLTMRDTALFGLIDYVDDASLTATATGDAFKVSVLKILFGNSEIRNFACIIELLVTTLFGCRVVLVDASGASAPQSVITLDGYYQHTPAGDAFSFTSRSDLHFKAASEVLDEIEITSADFVTLNPDAQAGPEGIKAFATQFVFAGMIRFHDIPGFDALSFGNAVGGETVLPGGLAYSNLIIHMDYELTAEGVAQNRVFRFDAQNLTADIANSVARPQSLFSHFPLKFKGFVQGQSGSTPEGLGYLAAATPITETPLLYPWYALQYELNLGTFGALASSAGFTASLLIGWSGAAGPSVYTGLRIPGASPQNLSFSIEGILGLSIDDIRFTASASPEGSTAYTLVFTNLALRFLGMKIPHSAYVDMVLFGNPDPSKQAASLGWYASYTAA